MTVVGVANSVTNTADAWVLPAEMSAIAGQRRPGQAQLLYRFASSATDSDISARHRRGRGRAADRRGARPRSPTSTSASPSSPASLPGCRSSSRSA